MHELNPVLTIHPFELTGIGPNQIVERESCQQDPNCTGACELFLLAPEKHRNDHTRHTGHCDTDKILCVYFASFRHTHHLKLNKTGQENHHGAKHKSPNERAWIGKAFPYVIGIGFGIPACRLFCAFIDLRDTILRGFLLGAHDVTQLLFCFAA